MPATLGVSPAVNASLGYGTAGVIPGYRRDPLLDRLDPTAIMEICPLDLML